MDLTNEDVNDILALLDSLPYDELDLQTPRFRLVLHRTPDGWTQSVQTRSAPDALDPAPAGVAVPPGPSASVAVGLSVSAPGPGAPGATTSLPQRRAPDDVVATTTPLGAAPEEVDEAGETEGEAGRELMAVRAPLPGTFYRAPRPGATPFVEVGSQVGPDTVVGIVETMKLMNSVTAGVAGTVAEICLGNAEFAAHGATLLRIRAD
jgi:acetyl-CoA carboxylase biotin carboxyl carrier protein